MAVWYLDTDDEITDAVARLRQADDEHVVFVVPPGSRIATGRINFKLLAREAEARAKEMAVASPDEQVRAMAASAGVRTAPTPDLAETALERGDEAPDVVEPPARKAAAAPSTGTVEHEEHRRPLAWGSQRLRIGTLVVLVLAVVGVYAAWQTLPTAEATLTLRTVTLGPLETQVVALPAVEEPDPATGRIPAIEVPIPLAVDEVFSASGSESIETHARGEVVFSSPEQEIVQEIRAGTRLRTPSGVEFQTTEAVTLPRSEGAPTQVTAPVEAVRPGEDGNVPAEAISIAPSLEGQGISVSNPRPTSGGRFEESPRVTASDYDAAAVDLQNRLAGALVSYLRDPANTPEGLTLYPETALLGAVTHSPPFEELVGSAMPDFSLTGSATARVLAVDESHVDEVTRARLLAAVPQDHRILPDSIDVGHDGGRVDGQRIIFTGRAEGLAHPVVDRAALVEQMAGLTISEARAILEVYGQAAVNVWPDFIGDLPNDRRRITLDVIEPSTTE